MCSPETPFASLFPSLTLLPPLLNPFICTIPPSTTFRPPFFPCFICSFVSLLFFSVPQNKLLRKIPFYHFLQHFDVVVQHLRRFLFTDLLFMCIFLFRNNISTDSLSPFIFVATSDALLASSSSFTLITFRTPVCLFILIHHAHHHVPAFAFFTHFTTTLNSFIDHTSSLASYTLLSLHLPLRFLSFHPQHYLVIFIDYTDIMSSWSNR